MVSLIQVSEGPVDIYELRMKYLAKLKETDGVMLPRFVYREKSFFITEVKPSSNDSWILYLTNENGLITRIRVTNGQLVSNGSVLMLEDACRTYTPKKYYNYWILDGSKPTPFFYENIRYDVKSFMTVPGSTDLYITAEREKGRWFTFRLGDDLRSKFTRHLMTNEKGHQTYDWVLENAEWAADVHRYF
nr:MAG TPA: hypothetical protein [Caudoviricetes sp.]